MPRKHKTHIEEQECRPALTAGSWDQFEQIEL